MFPKYKEIIKIDNGGILFGSSTYKQKVPDGWEKVDYVINTRHLFCGRQICIGKEKNKQFQYCPRCLIKIEQKDAFHGNTSFYEARPDNSSY